MPSDLSQQTSQCDDIQPWLAAYALGEAETDPAMSAHLEACPACRSALREYRQVAQVLPYGAPDAAPPPELRDRIIAAIAPIGDPPAARQMAREPASRPPRRRFAFWSAMAAAAALIVGLLGWNLELRQELSAQAAQIAFHRQSWQTMIGLLNDPALRWYQVAGAAAKGHFWAAPGGKDACLVVQNLPPLTDNHVYQVWLARDARPTPGGVFEEHGGNAWILVHTDEPLTAYREVFVTIEAKGGADAPSGPRVLEGTFAAAQTPTSADRQEVRGLLAQAVERGD